MSFDLVGAEIGGMDPMEIAKMAGGLLTGTGSLLASKKQDEKKDDKEIKRLEEARKVAEKSASRMKLALGVVTAAAGTGLITFLIVRK